MSRKSPWAKDAAVSEDESFRQEKIAASFLHAMHGSNGAIIETAATELIRQLPASLEKAGADTQSTLMRALVVVSVLTLLEINDATVVALQQDEDLRETLTNLRDHIDFALGFFRQTTDKNLLTKDKLLLEHGRKAMAKAEMADG